MPASSHDKAARILLADDHPVVAAGMQAFLAGQPDLKLAAAVHAGADVLRRAREASADAVVLGTSLHDLGTVELVRSLAGTLPRLRIVVFADRPDGREARLLERSGAHAYLPKHTDREGVLAALRAVLRGETRFPPIEGPFDTEQPPSGEVSIDTLSRRETQVLAAIAEGKTNKQIAARLGIGVRTVETHRQNLTRKLGVQGAAALTRWAINRGMVDPRR